MRDEISSLVRQCWPVHRAVLEKLQIRTVICLGITTGRWVRSQLGAHLEFDSFTEVNRRKWKSLAHKSADGRFVVTLTHPGRANWKALAADPTGLVRRAMEAQKALVPG